MQQYIDFFFHHLELWIAFFVILLFLLALEIRNKITGLKQLSPQEVTRLINRENAVVLDVRDSTQFATGHIIAAINIPQAELEDKISRLEKYKNTPIIIITNAGQPTSKIASLLQSRGFTQLFTLQGGIANWQNSSLPLEKSK
jgi:rhodanese-related sulfurtransferase